MKEPGGEEVQLLLILDLETRWGWVVSVTPPTALNPEERTPGTHCTGGWVGPRTGLDTEARGEILCLCRGSNLDRPVVQPVARHYTDWAIRLFFFIYFSVFSSSCSLHSWKYAHIRPSSSRWTNSVTRRGRTNTNIHGLSGVQTHDLRTQAARTLAPERAATVIGSTEPRRALMRSLRVTEVLKDEYL
jgi:hypothetical protein